jgi:hypothetical protein
MRNSMVASAPERARVLNAAALQNAVLCAECEVVSDSRTISAWFAATVRCSTSPAWLAEIFRKSVRA